MRKRGKTRAKGKVAKSDGLRHISEEREVGRGAQQEN